MATLTFNGKEYEIDALTENAKGQLASVQFVEAELQRLKSQTAVLNTARNAYMRELQSELDQQDAKQSNKQ
ncbi:DUF6447 family protein [Azonexus sp.]|uniref:DUF6447 family protein n=1 Tax=Azonexus sp. TaxID=1872668 RepID=UPI0027BAA787|nr:DUF6447 family protein [Azonexus sp.]